MYEFCGQSSSSKPLLHPFVLEGLVLRLRVKNWNWNCLVRTKTFFTLQLGVAYSVNKFESFLNSEFRNYDNHRWETNKQISETNTPCVLFDVFLFYHWERCEKVDHVRHRGLKECVTNRFSLRPYFAGLFRALQDPCGVAIKVGLGISRTNPDSQWNPV